MKLKTLMMSAAMSALVAGGAVAQTDTDATAPADGSSAAGVTADVNAAAATQFSSLSDMTVGDLIGQDVYTPDGDTIGDVDYVIDQGSGPEAVVGVGGFLGLGEYTVALPLGEFEYDSAQQMVTLNATEDQLKQRPEFDESTAESLPDETGLADLMESDGASGNAATTGEASTNDMDSDDMSESDNMSDGSATSDGAAISYDNEPEATDDATQTDDSGVTDGAGEQEKTDG
ncbi:PRC-barrel domain containing protein [Roseovarius spongiae]|uniref:PRC-barrel domain containing protein n=1 Tax=Roseovarius spongiae TaxID=2320272 RepID=A0A3A8AVL8_9RHOB|nr:PRC-barrel domain-containing protein [Roseovarius spongiae]RKF13402.1 PRC-barrel domain containing protein [Roseovarius spongiae]